METKKQNILQIDIRGTFAKKSPRLSKFIPGFVYNWIRKTVHEEEINAVMREAGEMSGPAFAEFCITKLGAKIGTTGLEYLPKNTGAIAASNHPLGGVDGMALVMVTSVVRPDIKFIVNDLLMVFPNFKDVFIPVNKIGSSARDNLIRVEETYASNALILIFPAGLCSRKINGEIRDLEWNRSFISRAIKYKKPVIPVYVSGKNTNRFYWLANFRKKLGIKANIEMFFLPDEMFKQKNKTIHITFGKPIPHSVFEKKYSLTEWAQFLRKFVYVLEKEPDADFEKFVD